MTQATILERQHDSVSNIIDLVIEREVESLLETESAGAAGPAAGDETTRIAHWRYRMTPAGIRYYRYCDPL